MLRAFCMNLIVSVNRESERLRLLAETAQIRARLEAEAQDGRLHDLADAGDRLLRDAEFAKAGWSDCAEL